MKPNHGTATFENLPDWLTPKEVARFLRLGKSRLYECLRSGEISSRRFGRLIRIPKTALRPDALHVKDDA